MTPSGAYRHAHVAQGSFFHPKDAMHHNLDISGAWTTFVLDKSEGFTQAGVDRLNDSICTYVWAILGALFSRPRRDLTPRNNFWLIWKTRLPPLLTSPVASPATVYASTPLDCVSGIGLYLMPSDMALHPENVQGYNNEIQIAGSDAAIGYNPGINEAEPVKIPPPKAIRHSKGRPPHQLGPFTRDHSLLSSSGTRRMTTARQRLTLRRNGRAMGRRRPTKKSPCGR